MAKDIILNHISEAFKDVKLEDGISISQARLMDDYRDTKENIKNARSIDNEQSWTEISKDKLEKLYDAITFLDAKGLRFYLPAYMAYGILYPDTGFPIGDYAISQLEGDTMERYHIFSPEQKVVIKEFLEFTLGEGDYFDTEIALKALEYW